MLWTLVILDVYFHVTTLCTLSLLITLINLVLFSPYTPCIIGSCTILSSHPFVSEYLQSPVMLVVNLSVDPCPCSLSVLVGFETLYLCETLILDCFCLSSSPPWYCVELGFALFFVLLEFFLCLFAWLIKMKFYSKLPCAPGALLST